MNQQTRPASKHECLNRRKRLINCHLQAYRWVTMSLYFQETVLISLKLCDTAAKSRGPENSREETAEAHFPRNKRTTRVTISTTHHY